jgi:hypothetical protein
VYYDVCIIRLVNCASQTTTSSAFTHTADVLRLFQRPDLDIVANWRAFPDTPLAVNVPFLKKKLP